MDGLKVVRLGPPVEEVLHSTVATIWVLVAHSVCTYIQSQADGLRRLLHVAPSLDNILRSDFKGSWAILLLECACEVALMIVLPLKQSWDLIDEFWGLNALASLVHRAKVASLERWVAVIVKESASSVACLLSTTAPHDVKYKGIARNLLVHLDLDNVAALNLRPIWDDEATRRFRNDKFLYRLIVDSVSRLFELWVGDHVHNARPEEADCWDGDDMGVLSHVAGAWEELKDEVGD